VTPEKIRLVDGTLLIDATSARTLDSARAAQTELAELRQPGMTAVLVSGAFVSETLREDLDEFALRTVRLNINQLVVVGSDARMLHLAAEREGSWDGESLHVSTLDDAYDVVQRHRGDTVVVLVTGSASVPLEGLVARLKGENA